MARHGMAAACLVRKRHCERFVGLHYCCGCGLSVTLIIIDVIY